MNAILLSLGVFVGIIAVYFLRLSRRVVFPNELLLIGVEAGDPRIPSPVIEYFEFASQQLLGLGFTEVGRLIIPKSGRRMTSYLTVFANRKLSDGAIAIAFQTVSPHVTIRNYYLEFCTDFEDKTSLSTMNSRDFLGGKHLVHKRIQQFPCMANFGDLYRIHRQRLAQISLAPVPPMQDSGRLIHDFRAVWDRDLKARLDSGLSERTDDGLHHRNTLKGVASYIWLNWPLNKYLNQRGAHAARNRALDAAGVPRVYERIEGKFGSQSHAEMKKNLSISLAMVCGLSIIVGLGMAKLYETAGESLKWAMVGIINFVALIFVLKIYFPAGKKFDLRATFCPHCGHDRAEGQTICNLCGEGNCPGCGYNLRANVTGRCPECGADFDRLGMLITKHGA